MTSRPASYCRPGEDDPSLAKISALIYSHPGEGKTVLWGTGSERVCFLASDPEGIISARSLGYRPHSIQVTDYEELDQALDWFEGSAEPKKNGIKWIVWDSLTIFQDRALIDDIMADAAAENPKQDMDVPSKREYMQSQSRIGRAVRRLIDLDDFNIGISCHVMDAEAPGGNGLTFLPLIQGGGRTGNFSKKLCGYMNVVGYLGKTQVDGKLVQRLTLRQDGKIYGKDRFNVIGGSGGYMDRPTLPKIEALVDDWRKKMKGNSGTAAPRPASASQRPTTSVPAAQKASK